MGLLPGAVCEAIIDRVESRIQAAVIASATAMLESNTQKNLARFIDDILVGDPDTQTDLTPAALGVDRLILAENYYDYISRVVADPRWAAMLSAINSSVRSDAGGAHASFAAYLDAVDAKFPPLIGEVARTSIPNAFVLAGGTSGVMHPKMKGVGFDRVYTGTEGIMGALVDETTDAGSVGVGDVDIFVAQGDVVFLGDRNRFNIVFTEISQLASADCEVTIKYWNGSDWAAVVGLVDSTTGFSANGGGFSYTLPSDWVTSSFDGQAPTPVTLDDANEQGLYYLRIERTAVAVAPNTPLVTWFQLVPEAITTPTNLLYGMDQPPIAMVQITDTDTCTVTVLQQPEHTRYDCPGVANNAMKLRAMNSFAANITFTFGYVDQDGNDAQAHAQAAWVAAIAAGDQHNVTLDPADTGIRSISVADCSIVTNNTSGIFLLEVDDLARVLDVK